MTHKQQVVALLKSIETGDSGPVAVINPDKYIPWVLLTGSRGSALSCRHCLQDLPE
jgi:hypothetical protein